MSFHIFCEEGVLQGLGGAESFLVVSLKQAAYQVLRFIADRLELGVVKVVFAMHDLVEYLIAALTLKRQVAAHEDVEDHAEGPSVTLAIIHAVKHFRRHVVRRASDGG